MSALATWEKQNESAMWVVRVLTLASVFSMGLSSPIDPTSFFVCTQDGDFAIDPSSCSHQYISCSNLKPIARECPADLKFDAKLKQCLTKDSIEACKMLHDDSGASVDCRGKPSGPIVNPSQKCSMTMWVCIEGHDIASSTPCPSGLFYDILHDRCDYYSNVPACTGEAPVITTTAPSSTVSLSNVDFDCERKDFGNYPDPKLACSTIFYTCSPIGSTVTNCAKGTFYDKDTNACLYPKDIIACGGSTSAAPTSSPVTSQPSQSASSQSSQSDQSQFDCKSKKDGNYDAGRCLGFFWQCAHGAAFKVPCNAPSLVYDHGRDACLDKATLGC